MSDRHEAVVNVNDVEEQEHAGGRYAQRYKVLTPSMEAGGGTLGVNLTTVPPGKSGAPFHAHQLEDEVFYVLSGTGMLRLGDDLVPIGPGDCISCPAGNRVAHQMANNGTEDLVYIAIGRNDPNEVCFYPDSGKVLVRGLQRIGHFKDAKYMDGEPDPPVIFGMIDGD